ncbi:MAG: coproporphyrinogen dehydrogenase HemZ [Lachnospiraceae bacterium]|nr:coproporphyrinogen dehydrogenase HemZ [Lachnospiraceae bacterium]
MVDGGLAYDAQALTKCFYPSYAITVKEKIEEDVDIKIVIRKYEDAIELDLWQDTQNICQKRVDDIFYGDYWIRKDDTLDESKRKQYKNQFKKLIYKALSEATGQELPWGTLTGVRPTKIVLAYLEGGYSKDEIRDFMTQKYMASPSKTELALKVAETELRILKEIDYQNGYSVYIGIPFCPTTCLYCSFASYPYEKENGLADRYLEALFKEMDYVSTCYPDRKLTCVYIGGGTPTALNEEQLERLLQKVTTTLDFSNVREFTVEAGRPDSITPKKLQLLKTYGVTRISINPQTMKNDTLRLIGRNHTVEDIYEAYDEARKCGHDNINMDLIVGLPNETLEDVKQTMDKVISLKPENVTVHSLVTKRAARLNLENISAAGGIDEMADYARTELEKMGYQPYYMYRQKNTTGSSKSSNQENIGYALPGKEGIYNVLIMEEKHTILAIGAGTSTKFVSVEKKDVTRVENVKSITDYIERIDEMIERKIGVL